MSVLLQFITCARCKGSEVPTSDNITLKFLVTNLPFISHCATPSLSFDISRHGSFWRKWFRFMERHLYCILFYQLTWFKVEVYKHLTLKISCSHFQQWIPPVQARGHHMSIPLPMSLPKPVESQTQRPMILQFRNLSMIKRLNNTKDHILQVSIQTITSIS